MKLQNRKPNRLNNYDYSQNGAYFVTICTKDRKPILSTIKCNESAVGGAGVRCTPLFATQTEAMSEPTGESPSNQATIGRPNKIQLTEVGLAVDKAVSEIPLHYNSVFVDKYVIMPNHIHIIIRIDNNGRPLVAPTVSRVVQQVKGIISKQFSMPIWQKSFYDHIIRDDEDYQTRWQYIDENPAKWVEDELYQE